MNKKFLSGFIIFILTLSACDENNTTNGQEIYQPVKISKLYPRYFQNNTGEAWIPVMINYLPPDDGNDSDDSYEYGVIEDYFKKFSAHGGNAMRIWISTSFLEIEDKEEGIYNPIKFKRIDKLLDLAEKYDIYIKFTLQHIRTISNSGNVAGWSNSRALAGTFKDIDEYVSTLKGMRSYLNRARTLSDKYKDNKRIFAWELWNEMDAVPGDSWPAFTKIVLDSVKTLFPNRMVVQTLGSLHSYNAESAYKKLFSYNSNDFVSIHRYLDQGTDWGQYDFIKGDIDTLVSTAMDFAYKEIDDRPIVINEIGAVEPNHAGPFRYYRNDTEGILIHDMIFAPFFCGAAGSGGLWHWDHYIYPNDLWYHFKRFVNAVEGLDPIKEQFEKFSFETGGVRCYGLKGVTKTIIWCRDTSCNWKTELEDNIPAAEKTDFSFNPEQFINKKYDSAKIYDPWKDYWTTVPVSNNIIVPSFTRSVVILFQ